MQVYQCNVSALEAQANKRPYNVIYTIGNQSMHVNNLIKCKARFESLIYDHFGLWNAHCLN